MHSTSSNTFNICCGGRIIFIATVIIGVLMLAKCCDGQSTQELARRGKQVRLCGPKLMETMSTLCINYNTMAKKSDLVDYVAGEIQMDDPGTEQKIGLPFIGRITSTSKVPFRFRRFRRGAVDECCYKSCAIEELLGYCKQNN